MRLLDYPSNSKVVSIGLILLVTLAAGCAAFPGLPEAQNRLVLQGQVTSVTGEPARDRLVVAFLRGREVGRTVTRCGAGGCTFRLALPWPAEAGEPPAPADLGEIPEGESQPYQVQAGPAFRTYLVQVLAGDKDDLPPEFLSQRLGMLPDGQVVVIEQKGSLAQGPQWTRTFPLEGPVLTLLFLSCCAGLLALLSSAAFLVLVTRWLSIRSSD
jgi:hypothetical protein